MKRGPELGYSGRYRLFEPVVAEAFDLAYTARIAAGRYWSSFTDDQRRLYLKTYTDWTVATYAGRFRSHSGEQFTHPAQRPAARGSVTVTTTLAPTDRGKIDFAYQLRKSDGRWRIVDIRIEGISQLALTRSQFVTVLRKRGFPQLIATLNEKIANLARGKEG